MKISYIQPNTLKEEQVAWIFFKENQKDSRFFIDENKKQMLLIGIEKRKEITRRKLFLLMRKLVATAKQHGLKAIAMNFSECIFPHLKIKPQELAELMSINFEMANFEFVHYKTPPKEGWNLVETIYLIGPKNASIHKGLERGQIIAQEVNTSRILANTPGGDMTPELLAMAARGAVKKLGVKVKILEAEDMKKLGMGGVLGVAKGSHEKPKFIILEYFGRKAGRPVVLVGKGVTFDTGGLNLKPGDSMLEMNMDMSGGAAVIHAIAALAALKIKKNVIGLIPAVENMPSGTSFRPGDILKSMSGKTIEVLNTDAEGRIILADALTYAKKYNPRLVVDVATLTGSALAAVGQKASALFSRDENLIKLFRNLGEETGEYVWPLPLWDEFEDDIKGTFGDIINTGKTRYGGAALGAIFLYQFAKDYPWVHLDIAPRMTSTEGEYLAKGSVGAPIRLLVKLVERY